MSLDVSTVKLLFLLLPGLLANFIYGRLIPTYQEKTWQALARVFTFAAICYLPSTIWTENFPLIMGSANIRDVLIASVLSVPVGFISALITHKRCINRLGMALNISTRYGGEDVWEIANREVFPNQWVIVRDFKANLVYFGYIQAYSETDKERELLLGEVDVFSGEDGNKLYSAEFLYISRNRYDLTIEIPSEIGKQ